MDQSPSRNNDDNSPDSQPIVPKSEEVDYQPITTVDSFIDVQHGAIQQKRPRGRPRKDQSSIPPKVNLTPKSSRSKTGCRTCRKRKKKCDEERNMTPRGDESCTACLRGNFKCEGYDPPREYKSGQRRPSAPLLKASSPASPVVGRDTNPSTERSSFAGQKHTTCTNCRERGLICDVTQEDASTAERQRSIDAKAPQVMAHLMPYPMMTAGVERAIDAVCLEHFQCNLSKRLTLYDDVKTNPFQKLLLSMAFEHEGLMRSLLSLASTHHYRCHGNQDFAYRALEQHGLAVQWLRKEMTALQLSKTESRLAIEDAMVASWLVLSLFCLCEGSTKGEYRMHMNVTRENLANYRSRNVEFNLFHQEYFTYHEFAALLTTYDQGPVLQDLGSVSWHPIEDHQRTPTKVGCMIGVYDGLLGFVPKVRLLRNHMRHASERSDEDDIKIKGTMLEVAIIKWKPTWQSYSPNWYAALLYQHMILVYLYRTFQPSKSFPYLETSVNKGLDCLEAIAPDSPAQSNALLPLFILGCASFLPQQRVRVQKGLDRIREYTHFGNIQPAEDVVRKMWELMDEGDERSWDWEKLMMDMSIDCLMT